MSKNDDLVRRLRPCPFCGGAPEVEPWGSGSPTKAMMIVCSNNGCDDEDGGCSVGPMVTGETPEEAERRWNRRHPDAIERGAAQGETGRAAMIVEGWSTAQNCLPEGVDGGWLAERDIEMGKAIRALSTPPAPAPDAGEEWKLVPVEPTPEMLRAGRQAANDHRWKYCGYGERKNGEGLDGMEFHVREGYRAMLAAAPSPTPQPPAVEAEAVDCEYCVDGLQADGETPCPCCQDRDHEAALKAKTDENERLRRERDFEQSSRLTSEAQLATVISNFERHLEAAEASNKALQEGLEPFAAMANELENEPAWAGVLEHDHPLAGRVTVADFRRARALLSETGAAK